MNSVTQFQQGNGATYSPRLRAIQHWGALLGGGALAVLGLSRRSRTGMAMAACGGLLAYLGSRAGAAKGLARSEASIVVNCTPEEAYRLWRNFEELPLFMRHLDTVTDLGNGRSAWVALGPMGTQIRWQAEIVEDRANERIAWRSLTGSDVQIEGVVEFLRAVGDRGTLVRSSMHYRSAGGALGKAVSSVFGKGPKFLAQQDMRRFKALIETGEIPTTEGQPHGPRSTAIAVARALDPDQAIRRGAPIREVLSEKRRVS
ncbi:MAG: SRPBCC family protein [Candidatus Korobacteraceae bacterium]